MVANTGMVSIFIENLWLRWNCLRISRNASRAPRLSNLIAMISAKSSMSIFRADWQRHIPASSRTCTSLCSVISVSLCPIPKFQNDQIKLCGLLIFSPLRQHVCSMQDLPDVLPSIAWPKADCWSHSMDATPSKSAAGFFAYSDPPIKWRWIYPEIN